MSVGKKTIMPHYVNVASGSFFLRGFLFCGWARQWLHIRESDAGRRECVQRLPGQLFPFLSGCAARWRWLTKTMTKKLTAPRIAAIALALWVSLTQAVSVRWDWFSGLADGMIFFYVLNHALHFIY